MSLLAAQSCCLQHFQDNKSNTQTFQKCDYIDDTQCTSRDDVWPIPTLLLSDAFRADETSSNLSENRFLFFVYHHVLKSLW